MTSFLALNSFAQNEVSSITLGNTGSLNLQLNQPKIEVLISYPMEHISGVCSFDLVSDAYYRDTPIQNLLTEVELLNPFFKQPDYKVISKTIIRIFLAPTYIDGVTLKTKKGITLKEAIATTLGPNRTVVLLPRSCK